MKTLIIILLMFIEAFVFGQDYRNYDTYDTVKIIRARHLPDCKISYLTDSCEFQFSKTFSIKTIDKFIKEIASDKSSLEIYEMNLELIKNYKIVRNYLINQDSVKLNKPSLTDTISNPLQLTSSLFGDLLPEMLDSGMFKLFLDGNRNYLGIDSMQIKCTEFVIKNLLSSIEKNSQWIATKNHLPNAQDIRLGIVDTLIKRGRSTSDAYTLIQFYDITVVDATKGEFNVQCDVSMVDKKLTQMLDIDNVSGINLQEPKGVVSHMVLCSDLPKVAGGLADMGFSLEKAEKWTFYFSINNTKEWDVEIRDKQTLK